MPRKKIVAIYIEGSEKNCLDCVCIVGNVGNMPTINEFKKDIKIDCKPKRMIVAQLTPTNKYFPKYVKKYNDVFSALMLVGNSEEDQDCASLGFRDIIKSAVMAGIEIGKKIK